MSREYNPPARVCEQCGKSFITHDPDKWAYKKYKAIRGGGRYVYFCTWGCLRKYEKENELSSHRDTALDFEY